MRKAIPAAEAETMHKLLRELPGLVWETTNASRLGEKEYVLTGPDLKRFRALEDKLVKTITLIREIAEN